ncbi:MAG: hypothetical protein HZC46_06355 [Ignavibacterium album]|nr:hypothetical protein [Ignavibacterium album]
MSGKEKVKRLLKRKWKTELNYQLKK